MKRLMVIAVFLFTAYGYSFSQIAMTVHNYYFYYDDKVTKPTITMSTMTAINEKLAFSTYALVRPSWGEFVLGFDYTITNWAILGFKVGIQNESNGALGRYSPIMYIVKNRLNVFGVYEWGGYSDRSQGIIGYRVGRFNPGIMEAHSGKIVAIGPMLEYMIPKTKFTIYGSAMKVLRDGKFASQFGIYMRLKTKPATKVRTNNETSMLNSIPDHRMRQ